MRKELWVGVGCLALCFIGCSAERPQKRISVREETQEFYFPTTASVGVSPIAYRVTLRVTNTGKEKFIFDLVEAAFIPKNGERLIITTQKIQRGDSREEEIIPIELKRGEREEFKFSTNGYTFDLLRDAGGSALVFSVVFFYEEKKVAGPYSAPLPDIKNLPSYEKDEKGETLLLSLEGVE